MKILVTGGCGFIGTNFVRYWLEKYPKDKVLNLDKLTYAGHLSSTKDFAKNPNYKFIKGSICDLKVVKKVMIGINIVVHFAAESHVDRSIVGPQIFLQTNVLGTQVLLDTALKEKVKLFHHVSTDEVFGSLPLQPKSLKFNESTSYNPHSPYSASKAAGDFLVRAYHTTYGLPITVTNTSNNYGPYQDPEKLIPRFIISLLNKQQVPLMGKGENIREWLHVGDHAEAIDFVLQKGEVGETYLIQGEEKTNMEITQTLLSIMGLDESMIEFVEHRLGHDFRYAINGEKLKSLGWERKHSVDSDLQRIVGWYKENEWWWKPLKEGRPIVDRMAQKSYGSKIH